MNEITSWSAQLTSEKIRRRDVSSVEVVQAHLDQVDERNEALNAVVIRDDEAALKLAGQCDENWRADELPPLYGVPVTTKINVDQTGFSTSNGLPALANNPAQQDSPVVANLKSDGAIVIGRTSTPEFSIRWFTSNPIYGVTHNPWNKDITPGGSSGAAASAVASGIGCIAHGNDLGGSLRYPAYCCGVAAIRPSLGRIASHNPSLPDRPPITHQMSVQGPIARHVGDLRLGLRTMAKRSSRDPIWTSAPNSGRARQRPWKIAWFVDGFGDGVDPEVADATNTAMLALKEAGHQMVEMPPPNSLEIATVWGELLFAETRLLSGQLIREIGSEQVARVFEAYAAFYDELDLEGFLRAMNRRLRFQRIWNELFDDIDAFLLPVSGQKPFLNDLDFTSPERIPEMMKAQRFLYFVNLLGLPSVSVPVGLYDNVPVGVQLIGAMHDDEICLQVAEDLEKEINWKGLV